MAKKGVPGFVFFQEENGCICHPGLSAGVDLRCLAFVLHAGFAFAVVADVDGIVFTQLE